jgi:hypothetical protein
MTSKNITVNGIDITVHSDGSITKPFYGKAKRTFGSTRGKDGYRQICVGGKQYLAHRLIAQGFLPDFLDLPQVDHIDNDGSNNVPSNLRMATNGDNLRARQSKRKGCSSQYRGVGWKKQRGKWQAQCTVNYKPKNLGYFDSERDAAIARDTYAFSQGFDLEGLNFPDCFIGLQQQ